MRVVSADGAGGFDGHDRRFGLELRGCLKTFHFKVRQRFFRRLFSRRFHCGRFLLRLWFRCSGNRFGGRRNRFRRRRRGDCHLHRHNGFGFLADNLSHGGWFKDGVDIGSATLQLGDKKAQCRKLFRHFFEVIGLRREARLGETPDLVCAVSEHGIRTVLSQHHQRALDLANRLRDRRQRRLARGVAEVGVQRGFDGAEIGADFACHRFKQQPFLGPARHRIEMGQFHQAEFFAASERGETVNDDIGRVGELGIQ